MSQSFVYNSSKRDKAMSNEQFEQIVDAILAGKYSWACLLILRFAGYNPLHYIPYRTYNRLIKDNCNCLGGKSSQLQGESKKDSEAVKVGSTLSQKRSSQIEDLNYLHEVGRQNKSIIGGSRPQWVFW